MIAWARPKKPQKMKEGRGKGGKGNWAIIHTGITVDRAWFFVVVPLNHGDREREVELNVSIRSAAGDIADTFGVAVDHEEKSFKK